MALFFSLGLLIWLVVDYGMVAPWWLWVLWGVGAMVRIYDMVEKAKKEGP